MKTAELPNGKLLEFPDETSDRVIKRTVRKELGFTEFDTLSEKLEELSRKVAEQTTILPKLISRTIGDLSHETVAKTALTLTELHHMTKAVRESHERTGQTIKEAMTPLALLSSLNYLLEQFNKGIKEAIEHSTEAIQADLKATMKAVAAVSNALPEITALTVQLNETVKTMHAVARLKKRAYRNSDGSWTMEIIGQRAQ